MAAEVNEMNVVESRRDFLVGGKISFTHVFQTRISKSKYT